MRQIYMAETLNYMFQLNPANKAFIESIVNTYEKKEKDNIIYFVKETE